MVPYIKDRRIQYEYQTACKTILAMLARRDKPELIDMVRKYRDSIKIYVDKQNRSVRI